MTRITSGLFGGRRLVTPNGSSTRPTSEKVRAAVGNSLAAGGGLAGASVLDLYAGSGALGLELVSRGAAALVMVERDRSALSAARQNIDALGVAGVRLVAADVSAFVTGLTKAAGHFDIVVADPPYAQSGDELGAVLSALAASGTLAPAADLVLERSVRSGEFPWPEPYTALRAKRYGDTLLCYGRAP